MNKSELKKLSKSQLIKLLLKQNAKPTPKIIVVDDEKLKSVKQMVQAPIPAPRTKKIIQPPIPVPRTKKAVPVPMPRSDYRFKLDNDLIQTENTNLKPFEIIQTRNLQNKEFNSFTNEYKIKF